MELQGFAHALLSSDALSQLALIAGCLGLAWVIVAGLARQRPATHRLWYGRHVWDGVLFPLLALVFVLLARWGLAPWLSLAVFRIAVPALVSLLVIRFTARVLRAAYPESGLVRVVERSVSWVAWVGMLLWVTGVLPRLRDQADQVNWTLGGSEVTLSNVIEGALSSIVVILVSLWASQALEARLLRGATGNLSLRKILANLTRAAMLFIGLMFALSAAGIDLTALGVLGGALGVGIGLGLQKVAANYVSGFVILAENAVRIGDMVTVDGFEGRITDITTRYTLIRSLGGRESIVPNEMLVTQRVESAWLSDHNVLLQTVLQVAYGTPLDRVLPALQQAVTTVERVQANPPPAVRLSAFAADGLELTVVFWIGDPENGSANVRSDVNLALLRTLDGLGVEIPFPQRVLHHRHPPDAGPTPA
ncbi:MAG: mechanosensitive ion channel domain-containing protein [Rubrivivax sp.]